MPFALQVSPGRLLDAPLPELLAELGAVLVESEIDDPRFFGGVVESGGRLLLSMPSGQDPAERDAIARALLAEVLGVPLAPLPPSVELTEL